MRILVLDMKNHVTENISRHQGTVNSPVLRTTETYSPTVSPNNPGNLICHYHPSDDPTLVPKDIRQLNRYLIGISPEQGFFINPALLAAHAPVTAA
jgi:DNA repair protein RadC